MSERPNTSAHVMRVIGLALRLHVAISMFVYGFAKTVQFTATSTIHSPVSELTGQELMWAFYGYSMPYAKFLGVLEMVGAALILIRRTTLIGCLLLTVVLANVITQDIVYHVNQGALRAAIIYQMLIAATLVIERARVVQVWQAISAPSDPVRMKWYVLVPAAILIVALTLALEHLVTH